MASSLPSKRILVVDDNPIILNVLSAALKSEGCEVFTAVDGPEVITVALREKLDLILLDIFFPPDIFSSGNTWDAFLIMQWLRRMGGPLVSGTPVFVMSGADPAEIKDRCLAAGAADYFQKPVQIPELLAALQQISHPRMGDLPLGVPARFDSDHPCLQSNIQRQRTS